MIGITFKPIVEVFAGIASPRPVFLEILVGRCNNSDINLNRPASPHALKGSRSCITLKKFHLERVDSFRRLRRERSFRHWRVRIGPFVECVSRAGKGALFMPEQF